MAWNAQCGVYRRAYEHNIVPFLGARGSSTHGFTGSRVQCTRLRAETHRDETRMTSYDINGLDRNHYTLILTYMKQLTACIEVRRTAYKRAISPTAPVNLGSFRGNLPAIQPKLEILMGPQD